MFELSNSNKDLVTTSISNNISSSLPLISSSRKNQKLENLLDVNDKSQSSYQIEMDTTFKFDESTYLDLHSLDNVPLSYNSKLKYTKTVGKTEVLANSKEKLDLLETGLKEAIEHSNTALLEFKKNLELFVKNNQNKSGNERPDLSSLDTSFLETLKYSFNISEKYVSSFDEMLSILKKATEAQEKIYKGLSKGSIKIIESPDIYDEIKFDENTRGFVPEDLKSEGKLESSISFLANIMKTLAIHSSTISFEPMKDVPIMISTVHLDNTVKDGNDSKKRGTNIGGLIYHESAHRFLGVLDVPNILTEHTYIDANSTNTELMMKKGSFSNVGDKNRLTPHQYMKTADVHAHVGWTISNERTENYDKEVVDQLRSLKNNTNS